MRRKVDARLAVLALALWVLPGAVFEVQAQGAGGAVTREDYEACQARDEVAFQAAIERVTVKALEGAVRNLDYRPIVAAEWRKGGVDEVVGRRVDLAMEDIKQETSWRELLESLAFKETQEKLATAAAERVYHAGDVKKAIEALAIGVGREVGQRLEMATIDAAEPTTRCLATFLGPRYGTTVARIVAKDAGREFAIDAGKGAASVSQGQVLVEGTEGLTGLVVVIMRRQIGNLAGRIGQRLVGAVLGRVVSVVAGGIGVALIAKDVWELRNGVLPIIAAEMKATATRDNVQDQLAKSIAGEIDSQLQTIGKRTSGQVIEIWEQFRRAHAKALEIAERSPEFKLFINSISPSNLGRLDELVALQLGGDGGEPGLLRRAADGSLHEAIEKWPAAALEIARDRRSLDAGFKWRALAGDALLPKVVEMEVHRRLGAHEIARASLTQVLNLDDRVAVTRLTSLKGGALEPLLELGSNDLKRLARALNETELTSLSRYMTSLRPPAGQTLLAAVSRSPGLMQFVTPSHVRGAILASKDQSAALSLMLRSGELIDVGEFVQDVNMAWTGQISPRLVLARYPMSLAGVGLAALAVLALLGRALMGRRPAVVKDSQA